MAKFWSRALFYKEWKNAFWVSVGLAGLLLINPVFLIMSNLRMIKYNVAKGILAYPQFSNWFGNILLVDEWWLRWALAITVVLVIFLFNDDRQEATGHLLAGMPFSRRQVIGTKWLTGALAIVVPLGLVFLLLSFFYWVNIQWIDTPYVLLIQWALLQCLFLLAFYTFLFFVQTVMGHSIAAGIVGFVCTLVPWFLTAVAHDMLGSLLSLGDDSPVLQSISRIHYYTWWPRLIQARMEYLPPDWVRGYWVYTHFGLKVVLLVLVIAGGYALAQLAFARNPLEKNGQLLLFPLLQPVLIWGFAICFGLFITVAILAFGLYGGTLSAGFFLPAGTALGYWLAKKTIIYYQK